ncbi:D-alanyl-D-alanine carboxypeptidase family protein [uncultured Oscillibacter sp.]|uniref:D-alanyl-D-alanine carboxypeptidase family protein n=1 Tax=uncultured Oscillibacter sp. TaxID=876091 RepID=UPI0025D0F4E1|nr:D-alanyl-D-alanine carboxypeptidase family protein [uncultured Oscillibacter sp.]
MKIHRFLSVFLLAALVMTLWASPRAAALAEPDIQCKAALLVDAHTGAVVYAKNEHQELYPASLTKIMTCLLTLEAIDKGKLSMNQAVTATATALEGLPSDGSTAGIQAGEVMTVEHLLYCMMVVSANEASQILAETISGSVAAFVGEMNAKAEALGCKNTHFVNPHGIHDSQHYTSAWDMYLIAREAMKHEQLMTICDTPTVVIPATNTSPARTLRTTNYLIGSWYTRGYLNGDAHGIKTGSTSQAGHCLVSTATRGTRSFTSVVLGGDRAELENNEIRTYSFYDTNQLFNWAFDNFTYQTLLREDDMVLDVAVSLSEADHVVVHPRNDVEVLLPNDISPETMEREVTLKADPVEAPVTAGDVLGTMVLSYNGEEYASVDLLALNGVEASRSQIFLRDLKLFFGKTPVKIAVAALAVLVVLLAAWKLIFSRRRYRYGRSVGRGRRNGYRGRRR